MVERISNVIICMNNKNNGFLPIYRDGNDRMGSDF